MDFVLIVDRIPFLKKQQINQGQYPPIAPKITCYLRNIFLLSNNIRENNNLFIYCTQQFQKGKSSLLVAFQGKKLRYLAPDERSVLFLLSKISDIIMETSKKKIYKKEIQRFKKNNWAQSTPGIQFKKGDFTDIWDKRDKFHNQRSDFKKVTNMRYIIFFNSNYHFLFNTSNILSKKVSDLHDLAKNINETSIIVINMMKEDIKSDIIEEKITLPSNLQILIFENKDLFDNFFNWELIGILQTLKVNLSV